MGCQQSTPMQIDPTFVNHNHASRNTMSKENAATKNNKQMTRSGRSNATTTTNSTMTSPRTLVPTVSLEVDEEVTYEIPKVDHNGNLLTEEIVRRTSTSLQNTSVFIGSTEKGGNKIRVQVCFTFGEGV